MLLEDKWVQLDLGGVVSINGLDGYAVPKLKERFNIYNLKKLNFINKEILEYVELFSQKEPDLLKELNRETNLKVLNPRMLSGHFQGRLLSMLSHMIQPKNVLEIGTYTGYSALCFAEGLAENGQITTIDKNEELEDFVNEYVAKSKFKNQIKCVIGNAIELIPEMDEQFDLVFIDADKENYINYFN